MTETISKLTELANGSSLNFLSYISKGAVVAQIFISYSRADKDFIQRLEPRLRRKYHDEFWYDAEIVGGDVWWEETIVPAIAACTVFVYLMSNDAISSEYCRKEMAEAQRLSKCVLPVIVRPKTHIYTLIKSLKLIHPYPSGHR